MRNLFALILVGSVLLASCAQKKVVSDQEAADVAPVAEQEAVIAADEAPEPEPPAVVVAPEPEPVIKHAGDKIFFDFDSCELTPASRNALEENARWLQDQPEVRIVIEGYADERGSDAYNLALGKKRAGVARDYLVARGIAPERLSIVSYGEEKANKGAANEMVWARDRKAEFIAAN